MKTHLLFSRNNKIPTLSFNEILKRALLISLVFLFIGVSGSYADTHTWKSTTTGGSWATGSNWDLGTAPGAGDAVVITCNTSYAITAIPSTSFGTITVGGTATCTLTGGTNAGNFTTFTANTNVTLTGFGSGNFTVTGGTVATGKTLNSSVNNFNISTGPFTVNGTFTVTNLASTAITALVVANGGILNWNETGTVSVPRFTVNSGGVFNMIGSGTRNFQAAPAVSISGKLLIGGTVNCSSSSGVSPAYTSGTLEYAQTTAGTAGMEWPTGTTNLPTTVIINNASNVTANTSADRTIPAGGNLNIQSGKLIMTGGGDLIIETTASISQTTPSSNYVVVESTSLLVKKFTTSASQSFTYPIGNATKYRYVELSISGNNTARNIGVSTSSTAGEPHAWLNTDCTPTDYTKCYWNTSISTSTGNGSYLFTFHYQASDFVGTTPSNMQVARTTNGTWIYYPTTYNAQPYIAMSGTATFSGNSLSGATFMGRYCCASSTPPTGVSATPTNVCPGGSSTLTVTGGSLGAGADWYWYSGGCGSGGSIGSGSTISVSPTATTSYYVRAEGDCNTTSCASATVTLNTLSSAPSSASANPNPVCSGYNTTLSVSGGSLGTGGSWFWYSSGCGSSFIGNGSTLQITATSSNTYYVRAQGTCNTTGCTSVSLTVSTPPVAPSSASSDRDNFCEDDAGTINLTATGGSGTTLTWYSNSCGGTLAGTGSPLNIASPTATTTYYARWETPACNSSCASVTVTVKTLSVAPSSVNVSVNPVCSGSPTTLTVQGGSTGTGASWKWYSGSCGGTFAGSGSTLQVNPTAATTYYVLAEGDCNTTSCASAAVTVNPLPYPLSLYGGGSYCSGSTPVDVGLFGSYTGINYQLLYDGDPIGAPFAGDGWSYSFGSQSQAGNYTVLATDATSGCQNMMSNSVDVSIYNCPSSYVSVAINRTGASADSSAILDISDTISGILLPRLTSAERDLLNLPDTGLLIYNTTSNKISYYNASGWNEINSSSLGAGAGGTAITYGVAVNNTGAVATPSSMLDVVSSTKGVLIPRTLPGAVYGAAEGCIIYNVHTGYINYFDGTGWIQLNTSIPSTVKGSTPQVTEGCAVNLTNANPAASAILDVAAQNKALLIPRLTTDQRNSIQPSNGLMIYNKTSKFIEYFNGTGWCKLQ